MTSETGNEELFIKIANKQFEMIGESVRFQDLPKDGVITINNKELKWYDYYKWNSMDQYQEWREWAWKELENLGECSAKYILDYIDFRYGFIVRLKKEGELF